MKKKQIHKTVQVLQFDGLNRFCNISHFVSTRSGGVSEGAYTSFNLGAHCGDKPETVQVNRDILTTASGISPNNLFTPLQIHNNDIAVLDEEFLSLSGEAQEKALHGKDALITHLPAVFPAVSTADCVPILVYAPNKQVVAAIHAGWRSTVLQITFLTIAKMMERYQCDPAVMWAGIGPSISPEAFEVGEEVGEAFRQTGIDMHSISYRNPQSGKLHINLWEANRLQLLNAGLREERIEVAGLCTYSLPDLFFSARRDGITSGRMLSAIGIVS